MGPPHTGQRAPGRGSPEKLGFLPPSTTCRGDFLPAAPLPVSRGSSQGHSQSRPLPSIGQRGLPELPGALLTSSRGASARPPAHHLPQQEREAWLCPTSQAPHPLTPGAPLTPRAPSV